MENATKSNVSSILKEFKRIIKLNKHKSLPPNLDDDLDLLTKLLRKDAFDAYYAYTDLLTQFIEYIDYCNIDTTKIKKSILDQIKKYCISKNSGISDNEEDNEEDNNINEDNEKDNNINDDNNINENNEEDNNVSENNDENNSISENNEISDNIKTNDSLYHKIMDNLNTVLEKAIASNNEELINNTIKTNEYSSE